MRRRADRSEAGRRRTASNSRELLHNCTHVSGARKTRSSEVFEKLVDMVGAAGFELPTPCAQGMGVVSNNSIVYFWFSFFPTV